MIINEKVEINLSIKLEVCDWITRTFSWSGQPNEEAFMIHNPFGEKRIWNPHFLKNSQILRPNFESLFWKKINSKDQQIN